MDTNSPLRPREAYRAYGVLKRRGLRVLLRDLDGIPPKEVARFEYMKQVGVTAEDIARAAGRVAEERNRNEKHDV